MTCSACGSDDHDIIEILKEMKTDIIPGITEAIDNLIELFDKGKTDPIAFLGIAGEIASIMRTLDACGRLAFMHANVSFEKVSWQN